MDRVLLLGSCLLLSSVRSAPLEPLKRENEREKLFTDNQIKEIQGILDDAAQGQLTNNLTAIELTLQNFLMEKTAPDGNSETGIRVNGKELPASELATLHAKLETVGRLLRGSLDHYRTEKEKADSPFKPLGAKFESGEHERVDARNQATMAQDPRPLRTTNDAAQIPRTTALFLLLLVCLIP